MAARPSPDETIRFGPFEVDLRTGELRRKGSKIRLQNKPFQILAALLEYPGELVMSCTGGSGRGYVCGF